MKCVLREDMFSWRKYCPFLVWVKIRCLPGSPIKCVLLSPKMSLPRELILWETLLAELFQGLSSFKWSINASEATEIMESEAEVEPELRCKSDGVTAAWLAPTGGLGSCSKDHWHATTTTKEAEEERTRKRRKYKAAAQCPSLPPSLAVNAPVNTCMHPAIQPTASIEAAAEEEEEEDELHD